MNLKFLSVRGLELLRLGIATNRQAYLDGTAHGIIDRLPPGSILESRIAAGDRPVLHMPDNDRLRDAENARLIYGWLSHLTPVQASDPRLWAYLSHACFPDYTARRWPVDPQSDVASRIRERYFVHGQGLASMSRHSIARLWWGAHLTYDEARADHFELTDVVLGLQDMQMAFLERAICRSRDVLRTALQLWKEREQKDGAIRNRGRVVQVWAKLIRLSGAVTLLDTLPPDRLRNLLWVKLAIALGDKWQELAEGEEAAA